MLQLDDHENWDHIGKWLYQPIQKKWFLEESHSLNMEIYPNGQKIQTICWNYSFKYILRGKGIDTLLDIHKNSERGRKMIHINPHHTTEINLVLLY